MDYEHLPYFVLFQSLGEYSIQGKVQNSPKEIDESNLDSSLWTLTFYITYYMWNKTYYFNLDTREVTIRTEKNTWQKKIYSICQSNTMIYMLIML